MRHATLLATLLSLVACNSGGGGDDGGGNGITNRAPNANAGSDQTVDEFSTVNLSGIGTDPDGSSGLTYSWAQTAGPDVTIADSNTTSPSFTAPDVMAGSPETLTFRFTVSDGSLSDSDNVDVTVNDAGMGANNLPTANAGPDRTVLESTSVTLDGSGSSDPDGDTLSFSWAQISGPGVTLSDASAEQPSFTSPDVPASTPATLTFELTVDDGEDTATDTVDITVSEALSSVTVSGKVFYEFAPPNPGCRGLNFSATQTRPIRAATVQLIDDASGAVLASTVASDDGDYSFSDIDADNNVRLRVRAELKRAGSPSWDVEVRDNVDTSPSPPPLSTRPLYVVDSASFNTGAIDLTRDLTATTGWGGSSYTGTRAAAPFAILDAIYSGMKLVLTVDPGVDFLPLDAFWNVNNTLTGTTNINVGEFPSSFYRGDLDSLFLLGDATTDTEEYDDHVVVHEWGHYFEDALSRSDSIGGHHAIGESIDARLAFGEGWATALAAIALDEPLYCDTPEPSSSGGFGLDTENNNSGPQGWYNEMSVATFIYDLFDTAVDGTDNSSIGFGPIYDTMTGPQANTEAFTTLFSFATELRSMLNTADRNFVDSQLERENIETNGIDYWASAQGNVNVTPNTSRDVLPLYTTLPTNGSPVSLCVNSDYDLRTDSSGDRERYGNKLAEYRYLTFTTTSAARYTITITTTTIPPVTPDTEDRDQSDPDMFIYRRGQLVAFGNGPADNSEVFTTTTLAADTYVAALQEWRYEDATGAPQDYPERICFDVTMNPL